MDLQGRFWVLTVAGLVLLAAAFLAFKAYELDFMAYIVEHTLAEKLHPAVSRSEVRQRCQQCRERFESGELTRRQYEGALLDAWIRDYGEPPSGL